jgi:hypothetical protein
MNTNINPKILIINRLEGLKPSKRCICAKNAEEPSFFSAIRDLLGFSKNEDYLCNMKVNLSKKNSVKTATF